MNKRQRKKRKTYKTKKVKREEYMCRKKVIEAIYRYVGKELNNKRRWRVIEKACVQEIRSIYKKLFKNMNRFCAREIKFDEVFEKIK